MCVFVCIKKNNNNNCRIKYFFNSINQLNIIFFLHFFDEYFGALGASVNVLYSYLANLGSISHLLRANINLMFVCKYSLPDLLVANLFRKITIY